LEAEQKRPQKANLKERLRDEARLEVIKEAKQSGTGKLEAREGRKKTLQTSFILSDGSNLKYPSKEERNQRMPTAKQAFAFLSEKKSATKLAYKPKDSLFDVLNMSGGTGGAPIAELGDPFRKEEPKLKHTFGDSLIEAQKSKYDTGLQLKGKNEIDHKLEKQYTSQLIQHQIARNRQAHNYSIQVDLNRGRDW